MILRVRSESALRLQSSGFKDARERWNAGSLNLLLCSLCLFVAKRSAGTAAADSDDFGEDREGHFFRADGADVESNGCVNFSELFL